MAEKPVARVGDPGSHGGVITSGASTIFVNGRPIARVGDIYACPKHGPNPIVTGAPHVFGQGQLVAHVGSKTACGAEIISGSPDTFVDISTSYGEVEKFVNANRGGDRQEELEDSATRNAGELNSNLMGNTPNDDVEKGNFSEQFCVKADVTGEPIVGAEYIITTQSGKQYRGFTDQEGKTLRVYTENPESITCVLV